MAQLRVVGDLGRDVVVMPSEGSGGHERGWVERGPAQPVEDGGLDARPEGVDVERVALGVDQLFGGESLRQEALAEVVDPCRPPAFGDVGGAGP